MSEFEKKNTSEIIVNSVEEVYAVIDKYNQEKVAIRKHGHFIVDNPILHGRQSQVFYDVRKMKMYYIEKINRNQKEKIYLLNLHTYNIMGQEQE